MMDNNSALTTRGEMSLIKDGPSESLLKKKKTAEMKRKKYLEAQRYTDAAGAHEKFLRNFSKDFFHCYFEFDSLTKDEKEEFSNQCAKHTRKVLAAKTAPFSFSFAGIIFCAILFNPAFLFLMFLFMMVLFICGTFCDDDFGFWGQLNFLKARKVLKEFKLQEFKELKVLQENGGNK